MGHLNHCGQLHHQGHHQCPKPSPLESHQQAPVTHETILQVPLQAAGHRREVATLSPQS